jgi:hypothetical protein
MKMTESYVERIKAAQAETKQVVKDVENGKLSKAEAAEMIIALREKIDSIFYEMRHGLDDQLRKLK